MYNNFLLIHYVTLLFIFLFIKTNRLENVDYYQFYKFDLFMKDKVYQLNRIYNECPRNNPFECGSIYEGKHNGHPRSEHISYLAKFPIKFSVLSQSTKLCFNSSLVISIVSSPDSFINRYVYRISYSIYKNQYPLYYFIGLSRNETVNELIFEENRKYDDMIIFDYLSSYYNNSIQFIMSMRWLNSKCNNYRYILSQQSDTFVNIPYYQKHFENTVENHTVISVIRKNNKVTRYKRSPWYIPKSVYNSTTVWPDFPYIPHIMLYKETVIKIINASNYVQSVVYMDDVYLGMLLEYSNLTSNLKSLSPMILYFNSTFIDVIKIKNKVLYIHGITPGAILYLSLKLYTNN